MNNVKKSIGWAGWTLNPVKGLCPVGCSYCYARRMYGRGCNEVFKDKTIRYDSSVFADLDKANPGDRIFVGSTIDLFHPLCSIWNKEIFNICSILQSLTFIFLTKCPEKLPREWPDNCWVGVSVTTNGDMTNAYYGLADIKAKVRIISFEPLHGSVGINDHVNMKSWVDWVIIGLQTPYSIKTAPRIEWVQDIVEAANKANIPVFLKNNLERVIPKDGIYSKLLRKSNGNLRQEFPERIN